MKAELSVNNLNFGYQGQPLLSIDHCVFKGGEIVWLKGDNGSGKTTLMRLLAGLLGAHSDQLQLIDESGQELTPSQRQERIVYLHPTPYLFDMSVVKNLKLFNSKNQAADVEEVLSLFLLEDIKHHHIKQLSAGQQQRLALARAWLRKPLFLLLDETLVHIDCQKLVLINQRLQQMVSQGCCIISCSHQSDAMTFGGGREITLKNGMLYEAPTSIERQSCG
jgi:tungstate transport system ATP-binding protein